MFKQQYFRKSEMGALKRKTILVSIYYYNEEPKLELEDMDSPDWLFLNDGIETLLKKHNPDSEVFDVCIDDTKPWLFRHSTWWTEYIFKFLRA
jgi:hypothetical protein